MDNKHSVDLNACKEVAICMLALEPEPCSDYPNLICYHPFHNSPHLLIQGSGNEEVKMFNAYTDEEEYKTWKKRISAQIHVAKSIEDILYLMNTAYYMNYLRLIKDYIHDREVLANVLKMCWTHQEFPNYTERGVSLRTCLLMFKQVKYYIMTDEEFSYYSNLHSEVTVYRGQYKTPKGDLYPALSWTSDIENAIWFARNRYDHGKVFKGTIKKDYIYAYLNNRGEEELILDYSKIQNIEEVIYDE